jgi:hypothetical protein
LLALRMRMCAGQHRKGMTHDHHQLHTVRQLLDPLIAVVRTLQHQSFFIRRHDADVFHRAFFRHHLEIAERGERGHQQPRA